MLELPPEYSLVIPVVGRVVASGDNGTGKIISVKSVRGTSLFDLGIALLNLRKTVAVHRL